MYILSIQNSYSWETVLGISLIAFGLGLLFKYGIVSKQRKRILRLEDEMLANHSRILSLEKKISEAGRQNGVQQEYDLSARNADRDLKVS